MPKTSKEVLDAQIAKLEKKVIDLGDKYQAACDELNALREKRKAIDHDELIAAYIKSGKSHSERFLGKGSHQCDQREAGQRAAGAARIYFPQSAVYADFL